MDSPHLVTFRESPTCNNHKKLYDKDNLCFIILIYITIGDNDIFLYRICLCVKCKIKELLCNIMGDYHELELFLEFLDVNCTIPNPDSAVTKFFVIYNFWPIFLGFIMLGITLVKCDYVFLLMTMSNFIDNGLNYALRTAVGPSSNLQGIDCPIEPEQMPALASQRIAVLYTVMWFLATFTYPRRLGKANVLCFNFCTVLALYSRMYIAFSTPAAMLIGCLIGVLEGFMLSLFFFYLMRHEYDKFIIMFLRTWYINIADTFTTHPDEAKSPETIGYEDSDNPCDNNGCTYHKGII